MIFVIVNLLRPAATLPSTFHSVTKNFDVKQFVMPDNELATANRVPSVGSRKIRAAIVVYIVILYEPEIRSTEARCLRPFNVAVWIRTVIYSVLKIQRVTAAGMIVHAMILNACDT